MESDESATDAAASNSAAAAQSPARRGYSAPGLTHFPLRKVVSSRRWKLWLVVLVAALFGSSVVAAGTVVVLPESGWPPAATTLLAPGGPVARTFSATLLLICAQLAVLVWWARSRSAGDFSGCYRIWMWVAVTLFVWAFCLASGAHAILGETAHRQWPLDLPAAATAYWLAPAAVWLVWLLRAIDRETVQCRSSRIPLWFGAIALSVSAGLGAAPALRLPDVDRATVESALAISGHVLIFAALVHHCRHVIYVTPEPPPRTRPLWRYAFAIFGFVFRIPLVALRRSVKRRDGAAAGSNGATASGPTGFPAEPRQTNAAVAPRPVAEPPADESADSEFANEEPVTTSPAHPGGEAQPADAAARVRVDGPVDRNLLKGLSKRERRQLRKQLKDERRAGQGG